VFETYPHRLSGGMRQRIMIAIAVACRPQLLIADEPTTALDVTVQAQILDLLQALKEELKLGLLLITHDLGVVAEYADRVAVMYAGRKVEEAPADRLFAHPMHPYTRGLLRSSLHLESSDNYHNRILVEMPGSIASAASERGCAFASRCEHAVVPCRQAVPALATVSPGHVSACPVVGGSPP
jgi:peptide/nickel transport system ATP-binding protein